MRCALKKSKQSHPEEQFARFVETARKLGCDESEEAFDERLKAVVGPKQKDIAHESKDKTK
jgi:hypothetical protein